jgi:hypothetical protein
MARLRRRGRAHLNRLSLPEELELILGPTERQRLTGDSAFDSPRIRLQTWRDHRAELVQLHGRDLWGTKNLDGLRAEDLPIKGDVVELAIPTRRDFDPVGDPDDFAG